MKRTKR